jgi:hypothetical protein
VLIPQEHPARTLFGFVRQPGEAESGHRFFTVDSVDSTDTICLWHLGVVGRMSIPGWAWDCWKP